MKKLLISCFIMIIVLSSSFVLATTENVTLTEDTTIGQLENMKDKTTAEIQDYTERYGNESYGFTAYILNKIRVYSIPFCFIGIVIGAIYQYVIGIRKLDVRDRGFNLVIAFVTILIICQILPLIFAIIVKGWRG